MAAISENTAYNLDMFDERFKKESKDNIYQLVNKKKARNSSLSAAATIGCLLVIAVVVFVQIMSYTKLNELGRTISTLKTNYAQLVADENRLNVDIDRKIDLKQIEDIATNQYGMHKTDKNNVTYIDMRGQDYTKVLARKGLFSTLESFVSNTFKGLNVMTEYLK